MDGDRILDARKIAIIIYFTDKIFLQETLESLQTLNVPEKFFVDILPVQGEEKFRAYNFAMKESDAKYKIYLDENVSILRKNILSEIISVFQSDDKIGIVSTSGAIQLSTHGIALTSAKRCGKIFLGAEKNLQDFGDDKNSLQEVEVVDDFFLATQYDFDWREDLKNFSLAAQCLNFQREGLKSIVIKQKKTYIWYRQNNFSVDEQAQKIFLEEYKNIFPLVSIIIPTFNRAKYFQLALESALNQTYRNFEIFITDNSTEDDTENLMQDYLQKFSNIKYFRHKKFTANDNWNFARQYNNPNAEFVNWLMDDDLFYPQKLEKMIEIFRNNPEVSLVTSVRDTIDELGNITGKLWTYQRPELLNHDCKVKGELAGKLTFVTGLNYIGEPTTPLIRKKFLRDNDLCWSDDETGFFALVDLSTWLQLLSQGDMFYFANDSLSAFRKHSKQVTNLDGNRAIFDVSWAKMISTAWNKKIFLKSEKEVRESILQWIHTVTMVLLKAHDAGQHDEVIITLEKTLIAMAQALNNGYKFELPARYYGEKTKHGRIS